jgi:radical SAM protein with 4Fe4S-binding SPASM domain
MGKYQRLVTASIEVTWRCNLRCIHCLRSLDDDDGLAYADVCSVVDQLAGLGCMKLTFTGGEPFMRRDFPDILRYTWAQRMAIVIMTNGTLLTADLVAELKRLHVSELQMSLYAVDAGIHDAVTGRPGSHRSTVRGIELARQQGLHVRVATPIMKANAEQIPALAEFCVQRGLAFTPAPLIFPKNDGNMAPLSLVSTSQQLSSLAGEVAADDCSERTASPVLCSAGRDRLGIGADGAIYPCDALRIPLGNVRRDRIEDIWSRSERLRDLRSLRRQHAQECLGCAVRSECMWCPGLSLELMGDATLPNPQDCRRMRLSGARSDADLPGWSVPPHLLEARPSGDGADS